MTDVDWGQQVASLGATFADKTQNFAAAHLKVQRLEYWFLVGQFNATQLNHRIRAFGKALEAMKIPGTGLAMGS